MNAKEEQIFDSLKMSDNPPRYLILQKKKQIFQNFPDKLFDN